MDTHDVISPRKGGSFLLERHSADEIQTPERFSDELKMIGRTAAQFVEREYDPIASQVEALDYDLSRQLMARAGEQGLLALDVPEEYGGMGASKTASMLVTEKIASSGSFNVTFSAHGGIGTLPIVYFGTGEQKQKYLPRLASGEWVGAYALSEPGSGSDARAARTTAVLDASGENYVLNGTKMWISNAGFADVFIVFAQVDGDRFTGFIVERDTPGLSLGAEEHKMGIKGSSTRQVILEDALVPAGNVLGEIGKGHRIAFSILNVGRLKLAAGAIGGAKDMLRLATRYAADREQFGVPIGSFGLIKEKLGDMQAATFALESAIYRVTGELDRQLAGVADAAAELAALDEYVIEFSFIKVFGSEILDSVIDETLQIFGGNGFSAEYPVEAAYRNSRINRIFEGTNEINRLLTSGQLLKRAMQGRIELLDAVQRVMTAPAAAAPEGVPSDLADAAAAVENVKQAVLLVAGSAAMAWMQNVESEQEVMARVADMVALGYLAESALLRAQARGDDVSSLAARLYAFSAVDRARLLGVEALRRIPGGAAQISRLDTFLAEHGVDLTGLRREAADAGSAEGGYMIRVP